MKINNGKKEPVRFRTLEHGDVFTMPSHTSYFMKTTTICEGEKLYNCVRLSDGFMTRCNNGMDVHPMDCELTVH